MAYQITHVKEIQKKSRGHRVRQLNPNWFKVRDSRSGREYDVNLGLNGGTCTCAWRQHRPARDHRSGCAHVIAAMNYRAMQRGRRVSVWSCNKDARRQHRPILPIGDGVILTTRLN